MQDSQQFQPGQYRYRIKRLRSSSEKYGPCEVCKQHVSDVHHQVEQRFYRHASGDEPRACGWTHHECNSLFGHEQCLIGRRRGVPVSTYTDPTESREYEVRALSIPTAA